ncbi:MAG TPA: hypothetical protein VNJ04_02570 [Gemmatimonadaceae bacterium]|nr:hypothetical protein [Gemmatimonadaceae bacterium]
MVSIAAIVFTVGGSSASAADQVSGLITRTYVLVEDTDLTGDVTCDVGSNPCLSFGASDIELRLNGFTITGRADAATGCGGQGNLPGEFGITTNARNNVTVRGPGLVQRFRNHGVLVTGSSNTTVDAITVSTNCASGILVAANSFGTLVQGNVAVRNGSSTPGFACGGI